MADVVMGLRWGNITNKPYKDPSYPYTTTLLLQAVAGTTAEVLHCQIPRHKLGTIGGNIQVFRDFIPNAPRLHCQLLWIALIYNFDWHWAVFDAVMQCLILSIYLFYRFIMCSLGTL